MKKTPASKPADHEVESSNSTANLFLGGRRKSWMLDSSSPLTSSRHRPHHSDSHPAPRPLRPHLPPPPPFPPSPPPPPANDDSSVSSGISSDTSQGMRNPPSHLPNLPRAPPVSIPVPSQNVPLDSRVAVSSTTAAPELALMSPVTPGETLHQPQKDAVPSLPAANPTVSTTVTTARSTIPATTALGISSTNAFQPSLPSSLPSPDPSDPSHPSPSSAVDKNSEDPSCRGIPSPTTRPAQIQTPQLQNSPLARDAPLTASVHVTNSTPLDSIPAPQQQVEREMRGAMPSLMPSSTSLTATGPEALTIDNQFWAQLQYILDAIVAKSSKSLDLPESVELPRVRLLRDACNSRDLVYLALHQVYCFSTYAPSEFAVLPGFPGKPTYGLKVVEQLLVENKRLSGDFLKWCVHFPRPPQVMMTNSLYRAALQQVPQCLNLFHDHWTSYDVEVRGRGYPPLIDELVVRFGVTSSVLLSIIFLAMCRRLYGSRHEVQLRDLWVKNKHNYNRRFQGRSSPPAEQMQRENEQLVNAYLSLHHLQLNSPGMVAASPGSPLINSPQLGTAAPHPLPLTFTAREQSISQPPPPPSQSQRLSKPASPVAMPAPANNRDQAMRLATAPTGVQRRASLNSSGSPIPGSPQVLASSHTRAPSNAANRPSSRGVTTAQPMTRPTNTVCHPQFMLIQQMFGPIRSPMNSRNHATSSPAPASGLAQQGIPPRQAQARANAPTRPRAESETNTTVARGPFSRSHQFRTAVPHTTFIPHPGSMPINAVRPNPVRVSLHQAHLRDPMLKMVRQGPAGEEETELFQWLHSFKVAPTALGLTESAFHWQFSLSNLDCQRLPRDISRGIGERSLRILTEGCKVYRLRCIKVPPAAKTLSGHAWTVAETVWPSVLYIFVNNTELYVRRKIHNGKDLPLDITDYVQEGVNTISLHFIRNAAESKDVLYVAGVEVFDTAEYATVKGLVQNVSASDSRARIQERLSPHAGDEDVSIVNDDLTVNLVDPFMARIFNIPVRGNTCAHQECFDLDTFFMTRSSKSGKGPMKENWNCPICGADARPQNLIVDAFLEEVHAELKRTNRLGDARAIQIKADGTWELKTDKDAQFIEEPKERKTNGIAAKRKHDSTTTAFPAPQRLKTEAISTTMMIPPNADRPSPETPPVIQLD